MVAKFTVDPKGKLAKALREASIKGSDLTVPLQLIAQNWFKSNRAIFTLSGPGKYVDLTELYKKQKQKTVGFIYPILKSSGLLEKSITDPADGNSISYIINKNSLFVGTRVEYAGFLHEGTGKMEARPVVLFGNEQVAPDALRQRIKVWEGLILDWVAGQSGAE